MNCGLKVPLVERLHCKVTVNVKSETVKSHSKVNKFISNDMFLCFECIIIFCFRPSGLFGVCKLVDPSQALSKQDCMLQNGACS